MSIITRSNFIKELDRTGIDVNSMDSKTEDALVEAIRKEVLKLRHPKLNQ